ncbi:dTDP-4-dehydrorhamnose 3,5-epimerase family protein [Actinomyces ruminis]|uniref:dTDP-4-keto-6-deoxy-D-glucose epimerase n=1 Tax=Actinomyces ruminis TaxID=1937003 RepID=A0ABX4M8Z6_9ACTO|nr:dTDP-4-dehydrorhamnose 3,5-epimerase [Actinomyces ruminis]PHP51927.1 dTDP-4-keto-6-deoxy-D-glucose epimerase [Actinomyces ruminis]
MQPVIHPMRKESTTIDGLTVIRVKRVAEGRGEVREIYRRSEYQDVLPGDVSWAQVNLTYTVKGAVRGLHAEDMRKLVTVAHGEVFGAYVDVRPESATFGNIYHLSIVPGVQVLVPQGVCNGFQAVSDGGAEYLYMFDREWAAGMSGRSLTPLDRDLAIPWPIAIDGDNVEQISRKDATAPTFEQFSLNL